MRQRLAFWICPQLKAELAALRSGNTKVVLENGKLLDELLEYRIERVQRRVSALMLDPEVKRLIETSQPVMQQS